MQITYFSRPLILSMLLLALSACSTLTGEGTDNTPPPSKLSNYHAQFSPVKSWSIAAGGERGKTWMNLAPVVLTNQQVCVTNPEGSVAAVNAVTGKSLWKVQLPTALNTSPLAGNGVITVGGSNAVLYGLNAANGHLIWQAPLSDPVVAQTIYGNNVIVKTLDGELYNLNLTSGALIWQYAHGAPAMVLAGGSAPVVVNNTVIVGFADGKLAAYSLAHGRLLWELQVAQPKGASQVEQMVDIVASPLVSNNTVYVVTYQGNLTALSANNGEVKWQLPMSSYTGMAMTANLLFVTDANGDVWAISRATGQVQWHQSYLKYRHLTAPVIMGNDIVIGDGEGYLHWLNQADGSTVARVRITHDALTATPVVAGNAVFVLDDNGTLFQYRV